MVKVWQSVMLLVGVWVTSQALLFSTPAAAAQLDPNFYNKTCPNLATIVGKYVRSAIQNETRMAASLLRLHFHDCFVQGCDASILLDGDATHPSEKSAIPNLNSVRGFSVIDSIKAAVESACPSTVSCADIVALAAYFAVTLSGGPAWFVPLGRRDALEPNFNLTINLPGPSFNISTLKQKFGVQNLTSTDLVALSGGHTIGLARCATITSRLYTYLGTPGASDPSINSTLLKTLEKSCPNTNNSAALNVTNSLDIQTPTVFDNLYFKNLLQGNGVFQSDQELMTSATDTSTLVKLYAANQTKFFQDFATSITRMGNLLPLTGTQGEIRKNCHVRNTASQSTIAEVVEETDESPMEKLINGVEQVHEGAEKLLDGAAEFFKDVVQKIMKEIEEEELQKIIGDNDTLDVKHSSM
ncbi:unnamed protein product [Calypogeia fissa]